MGLLIQNLLQKAHEIRFLLNGAKILPILSFTPHENKLKQGKNANFKGFDRFSMTLSPSYERHFQTDEARELGLVSF